MEYCKRKQKQEQQEHGLKQKNNEKNNILFAGNNRLYLNPHSGLYK